MATVRGGYTPLPHVQAFADEMVEAVGLEENNPGTYADHDPVPEQALDIFVSTSNTITGYAVCAFAFANWVRFGIRYIIYNRQIWNLEHGAYWRPYNGSSPHIDHVHITFYDTAPGFAEGSPQKERDFMATMSDNEKDALLRGAADSASTNQAVARLEIALLDPISGYLAMAARHAINDGVEFNVEQLAERIADLLGEELSADLLDSLAARIAA